MAAVFTTLAGLIPDPVHLDVTIDAWTNPDGAITLIALTDTDPDEWLQKVTT